MVNPKHFTPKQLAIYKKSFAKAKPYKHLEIKDFLDKQTLAALTNAIKKQSFAKKESDLFTFLQTNDLTHSKDPVIKNIHDFLKSNSFISYMESISGLKISRKLMDLHATCYQDTHFLLCHDDQLEGRRIAFMIYLSSLEKKDGGALRLYAKEKVAKTLIPKTNNFTFFEVSPISIHDVDEVLIKKNRIALAGWYYDQ